MSCWSAACAGLPPSIEVKALFGGLRYQSQAGRLSLSINALSNIVGTRFCCPLRSYVYPESNIKVYLRSLPIFYVLLSDLYLSFFESVALPACRATDWPSM
jgi:hypothetical protein